MKIAIIGAGAIGGYVDVKLALAGEDVGFIVRGANLQAIGRDGMKLVMLTAPVLRATSSPPTTTAASACRTSSCWPPRPIR